MALSILNNVAALAAENQISKTQTSLQKTLLQMSSGSKINSGSDDAAGLSVSNGLTANITALNQSASNASNGVGSLQVADGALSEVTTLLNRAVTLATESSTDGLTTAQYSAANTEYQSILSEITAIGKNTTFNGSSVFGTTQNVYISDGTSKGSYSVQTSISTLTVGTLGLTDQATTTTDAGLTTTTSAQTALQAIYSAISTVAQDRGNLGAGINRLDAANNVATVQVQNLTTASDTVSAADVSADVANMSKYNILNQTGISALSQANQMQQAVLKLLQ